MFCSDALRAFNPGVEGSEDCGTPGCRTLPPIQGSLFHLVMDVGEKAGELVSRLGVV